MPDGIDTSGGSGVALPGVPVLLLPVRLETRFADGAGGRELWLRVFPDQISIDTHEPELSEAEVKEVERYWQDLWRVGTADDADERPPWRTLAAKFGATRAAWIVQAHAPTNPGDRPDEPTDADQPLPSEPAFDQPAAAALRESSWSRAPYAAGLPARWTALVRAPDGSARLVAFDNPIDKPLAVGPDPQAQPEGLDPRDLQATEELRWMTDFDTAVARGMAQRIPLTVAESQLVRELLVIGMPDPHPAGGPVVTTHATAPPPTTDRLELEALIDAHRYTDGIAFVRQGTPTNNSGDAPSGWSRQDPGYERSFRVERAIAPDLDDGAAVAYALGISGSKLERVERADASEQSDAQAMGVALWPSTAGYFLREMLGPAVTRADEEAARRWFRDLVRPRGPLPALRVGAQPYGILPVTSLAHRSEKRSTRLRSHLADFLDRALPSWITSAEQGPFVGKPGGEETEHLAGLLRMDAASQSFRGRHALGSDFLDYFGAFVRVDGVEEELAAEYSWVTQLLAGFGISEDVRADYISLSSKDGQVKMPTVQDEPLSEDDGLAGATNYISWLAAAPVLGVRDMTAYPGGAPPKSLLFNVLRQSVLLENAARAFEALRWAGEVSYYLSEEEFIGFDSADERMTPWEALERPVAGLTNGAETIAEYLDAHRGQPGPSEADDVRFDRLNELYAALGALAGVPTAELERLFVETMDTFSHRLDPWVTSFATDLLRDIRGSGVGEIRLGAYGCVGPIAPSPLGTPVTGDELAAVTDLDAAWQARHPGEQAPSSPLEPRGESGGFIHAPSASQAAAAAVLRSGYLENLDSTDGAQLAIDLSSDRVRTAMYLLDGVREGQPIGALLGYRFERALHESGQDGYIQDFRDRFPIVANKLTQPGAATEEVAAENVVDGLALQRAASSEGGLDWPDVLPQDVSDAIDDLTQAFDSIADLSMAESVFQLVQGNYGRGGAILDAVSRGDRPPEPQVVRTPRRSTTVVHRVLLLLTDPPARDASWPGGTRPRALAEPRLDAWLTTRLPSNASCTVDYTGGSVSVALSDIDLGPLDLVPLAELAEDPVGSELEQRILIAAGELLAAAGVAAPGELTVRFEQPVAGDLPFASLLTCVRAARDLIGWARPLEPADLVEPERRAGADENLRADLTRLQDALTAISDLADEVNGSLVDDAKRLAANPADVGALTDAWTHLLEASAYGVDAALPRSEEGVELAEQATRAAELLRVRIDAVDALPALPAAPTRAEQRDRLVGGLQAIFGEGFPVLPEFVPVDGPGFEAALGESTSLLSGGDDQERARWVQRLTHVRPAISRLDALDTCAQVAAGSDPLELTIGQLPEVDTSGGAPADRWVALPFAAGERAPADGLVAFETILPAAGYDPTAVHTGLMIDEWPERIPGTEESTGIAFHYDQPTARAPQSLLVAVPPDPATAWSEEGLFEVLLETLDLARARTVTLDTLVEGGQVLPMTYFAFNPDGDTVSFDYLGRMM